jgi:hypothetical protein
MQTYVLATHQPRIGVAEREKMNLETARIQTAGDLFAGDILGVHVRTVGPAVEENSISRHQITLHTIRLSIRIRKDGCFSVLLLSFS